VPDYYVLYGVDAIDDYLRLLTVEEFEAVKEALEKFKYDETAEDYKLKQFTNNILYLSKELIEKKELEVVDTNTIGMVFDVVCEGNNKEEQVKKVIVDIIQNAEFIEKLSVEFQYKVRILNVEIYLFKLEVAE